MKMKEYKLVYRCNRPAYIVAIPLQFVHTTRLAFRFYVLANGGYNHTISSLNWLCLCPLLPNKCLHEKTLYSRFVSIKTTSKESIECVDSQISFSGWFNCTESSGF